MRLPGLNPLAIGAIARAIRLNAREPHTVVFVSSLLRAREIKLATALRRIGWTVILLYRQTTPFVPQDHFDVAVKLNSDRQLHRVAKALRPRLCHVFSGAVDETVTLFCRDKPGPVVIDLNDVFAPSLFNYLQERFEPTREVLGLADGFVSRDLQAKFAERLDGFTLPRHLLLFPEYSWLDGPALPGASRKLPGDEVHVVSVGTFTLETEGMYDSAYLTLAKMLTEQRIHFHIYPHWFYRKARGSVFGYNPREKFREFYALAETTPYLHMHPSLPIDDLARELPQFDFGIVAGGSTALGQKLSALKSNYMDACYSGRIADYLDARLPVLINPEVRFNTRLMRHYHALVDLGAITEPGFREMLLARKSDPHLQRRTREAAETLSLDRQAPRLDRFYRQVMDDSPAVAPRPLISHIAARVPRVGAYVGNLHAQLDQQQALIRERDRLVAELESNKAEFQEERRRTAAETSRLRDTLQGMQNTNAALRAQLEQSGGGKTGAESSYGERQLPKAEADELIGLLNWAELADEVEREQGYAELNRILHIFRRNQHTGVTETEADLSAAWTLLNRKNLDQLLRDGYRRFKRTIALNYFTFPIQEGDPQIGALEGLVGTAAAEAARTLADSLPDDPEFALQAQRAFRYHLLLLHAYARTLDKTGLLDRIDEPAEGMPVTVSTNGRTISQDLVNSVIEYTSIREGGRLERARRILEIGGGYGRDAFVIRSAHPAAQYIMVDVPPALYLAQRYLSSVFRDARVFRVTDFAKFDDIAEKFEASSLAFLLPHQLSLLPDGYADLVLNISSFGEMTAAQIDRYFSEIGRVARGGQLYSKQWVQSRNPFDGLVLREADYPVRDDWTTVFSRPSAAQGSFFEALYQLGDHR